MDRSEKFITLLAAVLIAAVFLVRLPKPEGESEEPPFGGEIRCAIQLSPDNNTKKYLLAGYNYEMLHRMADFLGCATSVRVAGEGEDYRDSLKAGAIDLLVVTSLSTEDVSGQFYSVSVGDFSVWLTRSDDHSRTRPILRWLGEDCDYGEAEKRKGLFIRNYDPLKVAASGRKLRQISPYDEIVKRCADSIGWDKAMLDAIIYQESRFHIEVRSHRGATGLMQIMPAGDLTPEILLDPEANVRAGSALLGRLDRRYGKVKDPLERMKITLAAYNAGVGRMADIMAFAATRGVRTDNWDSLRTVIPQMGDKALMDSLDTVKLGRFVGRETMAYVDMVTILYKAFKAISVK